MKTYNVLNVLSLPEAVYLSALWRKKKGKKKGLKKLQGLKKKMPLYPYFAIALVVKSPDWKLREECWEFLQAVNKANSLRERNRGGRFHHKTGETSSSWSIDAARNAVVHFLKTPVSASWNRTFQLAPFMKAICTCSQNSLKGEKSGGRILTYTDNKK